MKSLARSRAARNSAAIVQKVATFAAGGKQATWHRIWWNVKTLFQFWITDLDGLEFTMFFGDRSCVEFFSGFAAVVITSHAAEPWTKHISTPQAKVLIPVIASLHSTSKNARSLLIGCVCSFFKLEQFVMDYDVIRVSPGTSAGFMIIIEICHRWCHRCFFTLFECALLSQVSRTNDCSPPKLFYLVHCR